jgi:hypothetical protein
MRRIHFVVIEVVFDSAKLVEKMGHLTSILLVVSDDAVVSVSIYLTFR